MNIPHTDSTSIESWGLEHKHAFDSLTRSTYERLAAKMGPKKFKRRFKDSLHEMYKKSHKSVNHFSRYFHRHVTDFRLVTQSDDAALGFCEDIHTPPLNDPAIESYYLEGECNVFCAIRDPMIRFIRAYSMSKIGPCDPKGFERSLHKFLPWLSRHPSANLCKFLPQVEYVYGSRKAPKTTWRAEKGFCNIIL